MDINIIKTTSGIEFNVYRKPTHTDLGLSFFSFITNRIKKCTIETLLHRGYSICSNYLNIDSEFQYLTKFFTTNGYTKTYIEKIINRFLIKKQTNKLYVPGCAKLKLYISLPYFGISSEKMKKDLSKVLCKRYKFLNPQIILNNKFKIKNFFAFKDKVCASWSPQGFINLSVRIAIFHKPTLVLP